MLVDLVDLMLVWVVLLIVDSIAELGCAVCFVLLLCDFVYGWLIVGVLRF